MLVMNGALASIEPDQQYVIATGSHGSNYDKAGDLIVKILNNQKNGSLFSNVKSSGSLENLTNLEQDFADFALVQRNLLLHSIYSESRGIKNIEIIAPIYEEKLLIYHKNKQGDKHNISELIQKINAGEYKNIGFSDENGYAYLLFSKISKLLNIPLYKLDIVFNEYNELSESFINDELDLLVSFSLEVEEFEKSSHASSYIFSKEEVDLITTRISNTSPIQLTNNTYSISSFTFLVGLSSKIEEYNSRSNTNLFEAIKEGVKSDSSFVGKNIAFTFEEFTQQEVHAYLNGLPINEFFANSISYKSGEFSVWYYVLFLIVIFLFIILFISSSRKKHKTKMHVLWLRYNHIIFGVILLAFFYILSIEILIWSELVLYEELKLKSQILNMSRSDLHLWIFISSMVNENNGIFPLSTIGKLMLSTAFYTTWIGGICIFAVEYFKKQSFKKRRKGMKQIDRKNHIVIGGWNNSTAQFVVDFINASNEYTTETKKLVCIVPDSEEILKASNEISELEQKRKIEFVSGDVRDEAVLALSNIHHASTVVLFAENNDANADEKTLLRALSVSRFCRKQSHGNQTVAGFLAMDEALYKAKALIDTIYIIAEINDEKYRQDLIASDVNEIICSNNYSRNIITQSILNKGVSKVLDEVLTYNSKNEFYTLSLLDKENKILVGKTFDELLIILRKANIQLIGIKVVYWNEAEKREIIDHEVIKGMLKEDKLDSDIIINPTGEVEKNRKVDDDDTLIVFCRSEMELHKGMKELAKIVH
jgi:hypothetical protein